ncbi:MAG: leucyl aminopeptidase [Propionicimonas sp.]
MTSSPHKLIPPSFTPVPCLATVTDVVVAEPLMASVDAEALFLASDQDLPADLGFEWGELKAAGFDGSAGSSLILPRSPASLALIGMGSRAELTPDLLRDAAAAAARVTARKTGRLSLSVDAPNLEAAVLGRVLTEGAVLARYRYSALKAKPDQEPLTALAITAPGHEPSAVQAGVSEGRVCARASTVARDLANTPPGHLTATDLAGVAAALGHQFGFHVEAFDKQQLIDLRCGGILGVNAGSAEEPRMIVLRYVPSAEPSGHLGLVGKGIMYDSGGISLKPSDPMHLLMKMDMGGAAAVLGAFTALRDLGVTARVTGWLMCTDNMPSGSAYKLGDVLTARGGTTVEVKNTDAEGRLAMMDGLVLATEAGVDAIVDIATLTGAALMALGKSTAALFGNDQALIDQVRKAAVEVDEPVWQLPLEKKYRKQLDSDVADLSNLGGPHAGATTAALFLNEFVGDTAWAHLDIAGTMQADADDSWRSAGATGFGARLLAQLARHFTS